MQNEMSATGKSDMRKSYAAAEPGMSALGQKQTFAVQKVMSALPPKADIQQQHVR